MIVRGYARALEDAVKVVEKMSFPIDVNDRDAMLKVVQSCIGTKYTSRFGSLMAVSVGRVCVTPTALCEQANNCANVLSHLQLFPTIHHNMRVLVM